MDTRQYAAVEAGGTKFRVAVARGRDILIDTTIPTTTPDETLGATTDFIRGWGTVDAVGIACFGPLDLETSSPTYGSITATPKPGWSDTPVLATIRQELGVPTAIDVDVGGAALGEWRWGAAQGLDHFIYITVGTGFGAGVFIDGKVHHGMGHPEMGHITLERVPGDEYPGHCPFHGACLEGMAAGPAIEDRWGAPGAELTDRAEVWELEAAYLARAIRTFTYVVAPQKVLLGGGVMQTEGLLELVRDKTIQQLAGYVATKPLRGSLEDYIAAPAFGQDAGLIGAVALAMEAADTPHHA
ncbi:MAG: ROK family protein [Acidimicrobiia bacterium]|nr:ROK family protein [Acidimicrobiia bacterium]